MLATAVPEVMPETSVKTTAKIVLVVEYDGTRYHGFQLQAGQETIQSKLEEAIKELTGEQVRVITASRTDAGVHATGQVVSFRTGSAHTTETFISGLNYYLPVDIAVNAAYRADDSFNVRREAVSREYNYYILNSKTRSPMRDRFVYRVPEKLDIEAMNAAASVLTGEHDFASFVNNTEAATKSTARRVYRAEMKKEGDTAIFNIVANSFLMHQVRNTIGTLVRVGRGKISAEEFRIILEKATPGLAWPTAPAKGLCLMQVNYKKPLEDNVC
jgi:tRNA pseudouridine38-40 synthase